MPLTILIALLLAQGATPTAPTCAATDAALPAGLAAWTSPGQALSVGTAVRVMAGASLPNLPAPSRPGPAAAVRFTVAEAGTYGIALDQGAWIDVFPLDASGRPGAALHSAAHGHGPDCTTIRKIVRFVLAPGAYALQLSGLARPEARVMLIRDAALPPVPPHSSEHAQ